MRLLLVCTMTFALVKSGRPPCPGGRRRALERTHSSRAQKLPRRALRVLVPRARGAAEPRKVAIEDLALSRLPRSPATLLGFDEISVRSTSLPNPRRLPALQHRTDRARPGHAEQFGSRSRLRLYLRSTRHGSEERQLVIRSQQLDDEERQYAAADAAAPAVSAHVRIGRWHGGAGCGFAERTVVDRPRAAGRRAQCEINRHQAT